MKKTATPTTKKTQEIARASQNRYVSFNDHFSIHQNKFNVVGTKRMPKNHQVEYLVYLRLQSNFLKHFPHVGRGR